jgi:hypothetical protein
VGGARRLSGALAASVWHFADPIGRARAIQKVKGIAKFPLYIKSKKNFKNLFTFLIGCAIIGDA